MGYWARHSWKASVLTIILYLLPNFCAAAQVVGNHCVRAGLYDWSLKIHDSRNRFHVLEFASLRSCQEALTLLLGNDYAGEVCGCDTNINLAQALASGTPESQEKVVLQLRCTQLDAQGRMGPWQNAGDFTRTISPTDHTNAVKECEIRRRQHMQVTSQPNWSCAGWLNDYFLDTQSRGQIFVSPQGQLRKVRESNRWSLASGLNQERLEYRSYSREVTYEIYYDSSRNIQRITKTIVNDPNLPNLSKRVQESVQFEMRNGSCLPIRMNRSDQVYFDTAECRAALLRSKPIGLHCDPVRSFILDDSLWDAPVRPNEDTSDPVISPVPGV